MKNNKNFSKDKQLVKTREQAEIALGILVKKSQGEDLEAGIFSLRDQLNNPKLTELLDNYPDLIQKFKLEDLLAGNIDFKDTSTHDVKAAVLLSCILLLIHIFFDGKSNNSVKPKSDDFDSAEYIISVTTSEKCINNLFFLILSIVGLDYYEKYRKKMKDPDFVFKQTVGYDNDPKMDMHIDLMVWFDLARLFVEAIFIHYESDYETKNNHL